MAVYKQIDTYIEDGFGTVTIEFIITDDPALLFTQTDVKEVDIFTLGSVKDDLDKGAGIHVEGEFQFEMSGARIQTADDNECFYFALLAESQKLYVSVYINPTGVGDLNALVFSGAVKQNAEGSDLLWSGNQWDTTITPLREWRFKAQSLETAILDIPLNETQQDGITIPGLLTQLANDTVAKEVYVMDYPMYKGAPTPTSDVYVRVYNLIPLSIVLSYLFYYAKQYATEYSPDIRLITQESISATTFVCSSPIQVNNNSDNIRGYSSLPLVTEKPRLLGPPFHTIPEREAYIHYDLVAPKNEDKQYSFQRYKTLTDLCYALAVCFGCYFRAVRTSYTDITYSFVPRYEISSQHLYLRDATKGEISILNTTEGGQATEYYGVAGHYAVEGVDIYKEIRTSENNFTMSPSPEKQRLDKQGTRNKELLALSVSPTILDRSAVVGNTVTSRPAAYPHNSTGNNSHRYPNEPRDYQSIHTAIYLVYKDGNDELWWRPAIQARVNIEGQEHSFRTLADCVNFITERDQAFYEREYTVEVPWLCGAFSSQSNGSNPSWQACSLGVTVTLDNKDYSVIGIERNLEKRSTKLRLQAASRFAFAPATPGGEVETYTPTLPSAPPVEQGTVSYAIADEQIRIGDAVGISPEGKLFRMSAESAYYNLFAGIAIEDKNQDEYASFAATGAIINNNSWSWTPGASIYVRTTTAPDSNLSHSYVAQYGTSEDMFLRIGIALSPTRILIGDIEEFIYEYEAAL